MGLKNGRQARQFGAIALKCLLITLATLCVAPAAFAQTDSGGGIEPWVEYGKHIKATQRISPLENGFSGESVSLYNGATSFSITDIDIPGNSDLPVRLARRLAIELQPQDHIQPYDSLLYGIGNWDIEVPYMAATYPTSTGWDDQRCSMGSLPPPVMGPMGLFQRPEVWQGITVHVPGRGDASALALDPQGPGSVQRWALSADDDRTRCIRLHSDEERTVRRRIPDDHFVRGALLL